MNIIQEKINQISTLRSQAQSLKDDAEEIEMSISSDANSLLKEISQYEKIDNIEYLSFHKIDKDTIYYTGSYYDGRNYNNQDIYREVEFDLDSELLYDENAKTKYLASLITEFDAQQNLMKIKELTAKNAKEKEERATYEKLKKQFENDGEK
jgi:hypothetical protein